MLMIKNVVWCVSLTNIDFFCYSTFAAHTHVQNIWIQMKVDATHYIISATFRAWHMSTLKQLERGQRVCTAF